MFDIFLIRNISKTLLNQEKAARLLMVWREVQDGGVLQGGHTPNITGAVKYSTVQIYSIRNLAVQKVRQLNSENKLIQLNKSSCT